MLSGYLIVKIYVRHGNATLTTKMSASVETMVVGQDDVKYLLTDLLKSVSRSFYLSLRFLPLEVRSPISLAYLLARTTDTIADTSQLAVDIRIRHLNHLADCIINTVDYQIIENMQREIMPLQTNDAERNLLGHIDQCLRYFEQQPATDREHIIKLLTQITEGQRFDLEFFSSVKNTITAIATDVDLDRYTYLVAGCVGEFWTNMCVLHVSGFSREETNNLIGRGINFGKGLQLINILRDLPFDLKMGRSYLPLTEVDLKGKTVNDILLHLQHNFALVDRWHKQARRYLNDGWLYCQAVTNKRLRFACLVPIMIGEATLKLLTNPSYLSAEEPVKINRKNVYQIISKACLAAVNQRYMKICNKKLFK